MFEKIFGRNSRDDSANEFNENIFSVEGLESLKRQAVDRKTSDDKIFDALFQLANREAFVRENKDLVESLLHLVWLHRPGLRSQLRSFEGLDLPE